MLLFFGLHMFLTMGDMPLLVFFFGLNMVLLIGNYLQRAFDFVIFDFDGGRMPSMVFLFGSNMIWRRENAFNGLFIRLIYDFTTGKCLQWGRRGSLWRCLFTFGPVKVFGAVCRVQGPSKFTLGVGACWSLLFSSFILPLPNLGCMGFLLPRLFENCITSRVL